MAEGQKGFDTSPLLGDLGVREHRAWGIGRKGGTAERQKGFVNKSPFRGFRGKRG